MDPKLYKGCRLHGSTLRGNRVVNSANECNRLLARINALLKVKITDADTFYGDTTVGELYGLEETGK